MLTVKHVEVTGHENLYPASRVSFQPRMVDGIAPCIFIDDAKGNTRALGSFGAFYVMNEAGKTVQKWDLGGWPESLSLPAAAAA